MRKWVFVVTALAAVVTGCTETTMINTSPYGGKVAINGRTLGLAPVKFTVDRWDFHEPYRYRVDLDGYVSREGVLNVKAQPGRVVGIVLTYGVMWLFKRAKTFDEVTDIRLEPSVCSRDQEAAIRAAGLGQANIDVVCARYEGPPRVIAAAGCRAMQIQMMKVAGLSDEQARRACGL